MPKEIFRVDTDITELMGFSGAVSKMIEMINSEKYKSSVVQYSHAKLSEAFDSYADAVSGSNAALSHMYEWGMAGNPAGRLWSHRLNGRGGNRSASYVFLASKKAIPTPQQRAVNSSDPISRVSSDELSKLSNKRYTYYWKAPIAEYNLQVKILPRYAKKLFIPIDGAPKNFVFLNVVERSGMSRKFVGKFTGLWTEWWSTTAEQEFKNHVHDSLQSDLVEPVSAGLKVRKRNKSISLSTVTDNEAAFRAGEAIAEQIINKKINSYSRAKNIVIGDYWKE